MKTDDFKTLLASWCSRINIKNGQSVKSECQDVMTKLYVDIDQYRETLWMYRQTQQVYANCLELIGDINETENFYLKLIEDDRIEMNFIYSRLSIHFALISIANFKNGNDESGIKYSKLSLKYSAELGYLCPFVAEACMEAKMRGEQNP